LKQTQSENGKVTNTSAHEIAVKSQPQSPIPLSDSSAVMKISSLLLTPSYVVLI